MKWSIFMILPKLNQNQENNFTSSRETKSSFFENHLVRVWISLDHKEENLKSRPISLRYLKDKDEVSVIYISVTI